MRRLFLFLTLLFISGICFANPLWPEKIVGRIPDPKSAKIYQIQVGAFVNEANANNAVLVLQRNGLCPVTERYQNFTRVILKGIPASQVSNILSVIGRAGFNEVIIREDTAVSVPEIIPQPVIPQVDIPEPVISEPVVIEAEPVFVAPQTDNELIFDLKDKAVAETEVEEELELPLVELDEDFDDEAEESF